MSLDGLILAALALLVALQLMSILRQLRTSPVDQTIDLLKLQLDQQSAMAQQLAENQLALKFQQEELSKNFRTQGLEQAERHVAQTRLLNETLSQFRTEGQSAQTQLQQLLHTQFSAGHQLQADKLTEFAGVLQRTNTLIQQQMSEIRESVESRLRNLQEDNAKKLEEMRRTVDEKLHESLEKRLGESFKLVSDRLEQVYRGLGEMQTLANGVGDLKRVLTNVKTRGTWGEIQLRALLEQMLAPNQFEANVKPVPGGSQIVEFAIKLPGRGDDDKPCWLPIDSKFPKEQYERLLDAFDRADAEAVALEGKALEQAVRLEAKSMSDKYLSPPHTTDFGILFLPTEGLYAEVVKRPGLVDELQQKYRVTVAGPVTLATLLNALQLGFKTLALEKRSSEVWQVLSAVKTEFNKFGDVLAKTRDTLQKAARNLESAEVRSRAMQRKLKGVDELPEVQATQLLGLAEPWDELDSTPETGHDADLTS